MAEICPDLLINHLEGLLESMFSIASNSDLLSDTRHSAIEFFVTLCESKTSIVRKQVQILTKFVSLLLSMMADIEDNPNWNQGEVRFTLNILKHCLRKISLTDFILSNIWDKDSRY